MKTKMMIIIICILVLSGCGDRMYLERSDIILLLGIDLDEKNELTFYASTPVFNREAKKNTHIMKVKARSLREARYIFDSVSQGTIVKGKIQTILIGKKLLQNKPILPYLDVILRDPKDDLNSRVVMVDGPVEDILYSNMEDKGRLGVVIRNMIDSTFSSGVIANPNLQQYTAQQYDKRFSPMIPSIKTIGTEPKINGMALLTNKGLYISTWNLHQSPLAMALQSFFTERIPITLHISSNKMQIRKDMRWLSIGIKNIKRKVNTTIVNGHFHFDVQLTLYADLVERMFFLDSAQHAKLLKSMIEKQLDLEFNKLVIKTQEKKIDPIGFGIYARAQQYDQWKKVQDNWFEEFSKANVNIQTKLILINTGVSH